MYIKNFCRIINVNFLMADGSTAEDEASRFHNHVDHGFNITIPTQGQRKITKIIIQYHFLSLQ